MNETQRGRGGESLMVVGLLVFLALVVLGGAGALWLRQGIERSRMMEMQARRAAEEARMVAEQSRMEAEEVAHAAEAARKEAELVLRNVQQSQSPVDSPAMASESEAIRQVLLDQQAAWNTGDIDGFMQGYWKSDELSFSSGGATRRSWQTTLEHYRQRYPTREAMGTLTFSEIEVNLLTDDAAFVLGRWELEGIAAGNFTLVLRRFAEGWRVIHDHTSSTP